MISPMASKETDEPQATMPRPPAAEAFRLLVERIKDYAIFLLDTNGYILSWNEGVRRIKGYDPEEIIGRHIAVFYTPEDLRRELPRQLLDKAKRDGQVEHEGWRVRKDGSRFWADVVITALRDDEGNLRGFGKVTRDLTERKQTQDALSELSGRLVGLQDEERRRTVHELHDTTSPLLTSLIGKLYSARQLTGDDPQIGPLIAEALTMAEATGTVVRTVSSMLYPPLIEQSGLVPALRWYIEMFTKRTGLTVNSVLPLTMKRLPLEHEVVVFRIVQEHLRVSEAVSGGIAIRINLRLSADQLDLFLEAIDGEWDESLHGIRTGSGESGAIFAGLRERLRQLGGTLNIQSGLKGLTVRVRLPTQTSD